MEEIILKPCLEQLKIDIKNEATNYLLVSLLVMAVFILLDASALALFLPFGFLVIYHKYITLKKSLNYRWVKIRKDVVLQEAPGMHVDLKKFAYAHYSRVHLSRGQIYFKSGKQKMKISLGGINLTAYPDKEKIVNEINEKIKEYKS